MKRVHNQRAPVSRPLYVQQYGRAKRPEHKVLPRASLHPCNGDPCDWGGLFQLFRSFLRKWR